ncbi:MAG: DUF1592 domain-containing protein [Fuerstiella sp.]
MSQSSPEKEARPPIHKRPARKSSVSRPKVGKSPSVANSKVPTGADSASTSRSRRVDRLARQRQRSQRAAVGSASVSASGHRSQLFPVIAGIGVAVCVCVGSWFAYSEYVADASGVANQNSIGQARSSADADRLGMKRPEALLASTNAAAMQARRQREEDVKQRTAAMKKQLIPFLTKYCVDCHSGADAEAGIPVDELTSVDQFLTERKNWEKVYRMINSGIMPPADYDPLPTEDEVKPITDLMHDELYSFDCDLVYNPGRPTVQRLNRTEYNNTIQDIFGIDLTPADKFPADDVGEGFDNIGDVLTLPPLLMEKYLNAADEIASAVIDTRDASVETIQSLHATDMKATSGASGTSMGMAVLASHGTFEKQLEIPATGQYEIVINAGADQAGDEKAKFAVLIQDKSVAEFTVQEHRKKETFRKTMQLQQGKQKLGIRFLNDFYDSEAKGRKDRNLGVGEIVLTGPLKGSGEVIRSAVHQKLVTAVPNDKMDLMTAAQAVLRPIMEKAFRRDVSTSEVFRYAGLVRSAVQDMGETYEQGISLAIQAVLVSPDFLFRIEKDPGVGQSERRLDDFEVATRLSYFLWSTLPDDELFQLAKKRQLTKPDVLKRQVRRMLKDDKADALVVNFASQWLNLRNLEEVNPNTDVFKGFDRKLKDDMRRETELLFSTIMKEDRSVEDLLTADYTFVNHRLAKHYGIKGVKSSEFERISLDGTNRAGVLTHASILTLTSNPGRTSPVKRGKWIMENIFGDAPPPAPPDVPELEETVAVSPDLSLREQLAKHREDPSCAACHKVMDPLGLGLENFNAVGQWREKDEGHPIDASGSLPSGESFAGPLELIQIISGRREQFKRTLAEKMMTYALGRGTEYYDKCTIDNCLLSMKERGDRFSILVEGIVLSDPFLKKHSAEETQNVTMKGP